MRVGRGAAVCGAASRTNWQRGRVKGDKFRQIGRSKGGKKEREGRKIFRSADRIRLGAAAVGERAIPASLAWLCLDAREGVAHVAKYVSRSGHVCMDGWMGT